VINVEQFALVTIVDEHPSALEAPAADYRIVDLRLEAVHIGIEFRENLFRSALRLT
jgi:hypothetical protein